MDIEQIVKSLESNSDFKANWKIITENAEFSTSEVDRENPKNAQFESITENLNSLLKNWESRKEQNANINSLCELLQNSGFPKVSESLSEAGSESMLLPAISLFNSRIWFGFSSKTNSFHGRENEMQKLTNIFENSSTSVVILNGPNGIGKATLAQQFASQAFKTKKTSCTCFVVDENGSLRESLRSFAIEHGIPTNQTTEKLLSSIGKFILSKTDRWIFIVKNVSKMSEQIKSLLKTMFLKFNKISLTLLLTNDSNAFSDYETIKLSELPSCSSEQFVLQSLEIEKLNDSVTSFCIVLRNFPIALELAIAYINKTKKTDDSYGISDYLKEFKNKQKVPGNIFCDILDEYKYATFTALKVTWDKLNTMGEIGQTAIQILQILAYLTSDHVNVSYLQSVVFQANFDTLTEIEFENSLLLLEEYSLVKINKSEVRVHQLTQEFTQQNLIKSNTEFDFLEALITVMMALLRKYPFTSYLMASDSRIHWDKHVISVWNYSTRKHKRIYRIQKFVANQIAVYLLNERDSGSNAFFENHLNEMKKIFGEWDLEVLKLERKWLHIQMTTKVRTVEDCKFPLYRLLEKAKSLHLGGEEISTEIEESIAIAEGYRNPRESTKIYKRVVLAKIKLFGANHWGTIESIRQLSRRLIYFKEWEEATELLKTVFQWEKVNLGVKHWKTFLTMKKLCAVLKEQKHFSEVRNVLREMISFQTIDDNVNWIEKMIYFMSVEIEKSNFEKSIRVI